MMKKIFPLLLFAFVLLLVPFSVNAESISDIRSKISGLESEKAANDAKAAEVQKKIDKVKAEMQELTRKIAEVVKEQDATKKEIEDLQKQIKAKNEEIKDLIAFYQISDNDNFYLKFIFGADSFEDFIYRFSVAEQLTDANDKLVDEMDALIKENKKKQEDLKTEEKKLDELDKQAAKKVESLGDKKEGLVEFNMSTDDKIAILEKQISYYKKLGCSENQDVSSCTSGGVSSRNVPSSSGFIRPVSHGYIMNDGLSEFGWRTHPIYGYGKFHEGMDINGVDYGTPVLAAATGTVAYTGIWGGGGNTVILYHNVNGTYYSTYYLHLNSINVSMGQLVNQGDTIGGAGSTGASTGVHLHFQVISGHGTFYDTSQLINPRNVVNFPATGVYW